MVVVAFFMVVVARPSLEQKFEILKDIEKQESVKAGLEKYQLSSSTYSKWRRPSIGWPRARRDSGNTSAERTQLLIEYHVAPDFAASRPFLKRWLISGRAPSMLGAPPDRAHN
jgi:hypothetical protein